MNDKLNPIKTKLISAGVKNLKEFGYPTVNAENILTDMVFKQFFVSMLKDNLGMAGAVVDSAINELLKQTESP